MDLCQFCHLADGKIVIFYAKIEIMEPAAALRTGYINTLFAIFQCSILFPSLDRHADQLNVLSTGCFCFRKGISLTFGAKEKGL
jgi:hypothetical protein